MDKCVQVASIHDPFEAMHPSLDGNGRTGRLLIVMPLCFWDPLPQPPLHLSAHFEANRQMHYDLLLTVSPRGAGKEWTLFFLAGSRKSVA